MKSENKDYEGLFVLSIPVILFIIIYTLAEETENGGEKNGSGSKYFVFD
jgi:hypothetical protein